MFARVIDGVVVDISATPTLNFHPDIASEFIDVPENTQVGWVFDEQNQTFSAPPIEQEDPIFRTKFTRPQFKLLFSSTERLAIKTIREGSSGQTKSILDDIFDILDDPATTVIDVQTQYVIDMVYFVRDLGVLTSARADEILQGVEINQFG